MGLCGPEPPLSRQMPRTAMPGPPSPASMKGAAPEEEEKEEQEEEQWECAWCTDFAPHEERTEGPDGSGTLCRACGSSFGGAVEVGEPEREEGAVGRAINAVIGKSGLRLQPAAGPELEPEPELEPDGSTPLDSDGWECSWCTEWEEASDRCHGPDGPCTLCRTCAAEMDAPNQGDGAPLTLEEATSVVAPDVEAIVNRVSREVRARVAERQLQNGAEAEVGDGSAASALDAKARLLELSESGTATAMSPTETEAAADRLLGLEPGAKVKSEPDRPISSRRSPPRLPGQSSPAGSDLSLRAAEALGVARGGSGRPTDTRSVSPALAAAAARFHSPYRSARGQPVRKQAGKADSPGRQVGSAEAGLDADSSSKLSLSIASVLAESSQASVGESESSLGMASIVTQLTAIQAADRWLAQGNITPKSELLNKLATPKRVKSPPAFRPSPPPPRRGDESAGAVFDRLSTGMTAAIKEKLPEEVKKQKKLEDKQKEKHAKTKAAAAHQRKMDQVTKRMTDPSQFVGVCKHRLKEDGKGKGVLQEEAGFAEKVLEEHFISQLDTVPPKPKPRLGICRVCKLPLQSTTATVHAGCKKTQAEDIAGVAERLHSKPSRDDAVYKAKLLKKQEEAAEELEQKYLVEVKRRHKPISQDQSDKFVERQEMTRATNQQKLEEKRQRQKAEDGTNTFSPQLNQRSVKMASAQNRAGTAFERQHAWAVANHMKNHMRLKKLQLQELSEHHVKSPRLLEAAQAEYQEAMTAFDQARRELCELSQQFGHAKSWQGDGAEESGREQSAVSKRDGAASGSDVGGGAAVPEPEADPELVAGLQKEVSAADAEQSTINWAKAYADLPPDGADSPGACEADQDATSASASAADSDGHQPVQAVGHKEEKEAPALPSAVGMIRRRKGGKAASGRR